MSPVSATSKRLSWGALAMLPIDAAVFGVAVYATTHAALFWADGLVPWSKVQLTAAVGLIAVLAVSVAGVRLVGDRKWWKVAVDLALFAAPPLLLTYVVLNVAPSINRDPEHPGQVNPLFVPIEWHKLPRNLLQILDAFPVFGAVVATLVVVLGVLRFKLGWKRTVLAVFLAWMVVAQWRFRPEQLGSRAYTFKVEACVPIVVLAIASVLGWPRFYARASVVAISFGVLFAFYSAMVPFEVGARAAAVPGLEVLYPPPGVVPEIPTEYLRDVSVDHEANGLYATYGPTSGIIRLDLGSHVLTRHHTEGLFRHFRTWKGEPRLWTVDWLYSELLTFEKPGFGLVSKQPITDDVLIQPIDLEVLPEGYAIVSTEYPAVTLFDRDTLAKKAQINFHETGLTKFRSGAWLINHDPVANELYVEVGMLDLSDQFAIVKLDPATLAVKDTLKLAAGGLTMVPLPTKRSLLLGDFYSHDLVEIDMAPLKIRRAFKTVLNCRSVAYDPKRDLIYAASFITGDLEVLRYADGSLVKRAYVGKKPSGFYLDQEDGADALYFGSSTGILKLDLATFLG